MAVVDLKHNKLARFQHEILIGPTLLELPGAANAGDGQQQQQPEGHGQRLPAALPPVKQLRPLRLHRRRHQKLTPARLQVLQGPNSVENIPY